MRATILPYAIILTKAHRVAVSIIAKGSITPWALVSIIAQGSIVAWVLPLRCFLFLLPN